MKKVLTAILILCVGIFIVSSASAQVTGHWRSNSGGNYFIHQVGDRVYWLGESADGGATWTHVAIGSIRGNQIELTWADVPKGRIQQSGNLVVRVDSPTQLTRVSQTGGFGDTAWTRVDVAPPPPAALSAVYRGMDRDVVGPGGQATPNGQMDGHFTLTLDTHGPRRVVNYILLQSADAQGNPAGGQVWDTRPGGAWILGVYRGERRLNPTDQDISDPVERRVQYDVYGNDSGWFRPGQNFRLTVRFAEGGEAVAFAQVAVAPPPPPIDFTGVWRGNDGSTYYIRQIGNQVFWLGESGDGGRSWTNIAVGAVSGSRVTLEWGNVAKGQARNHGRVVLRVDAPNRMVLIEETGGFRTLAWDR